MKLPYSLEEHYPPYKESRLYGRYITPAHIAECDFYTRSRSLRSIIGHSVEGRPIELFTIGSGPVKVLLWSQMHGNESTTTKAMADVFTILSSNTIAAGSIPEQCTLYWIPILNPDGAVAYTRENANGVDLNRDAQHRTQPESAALRHAFETLKPDFCFNLHDQRSIYGVGDTPNPAVLSFLTPSQDEARTVSAARKKSMTLIVAMNSVLQPLLPGQVGRYSDAFNLHCTGDTFQSEGVPTLLFEAGHYKEDYRREETRKFIFYALMQSLYTISENTFGHYNYEDYFAIPENKKTFFDILIRDFPCTNTRVTDIAIHYEEVLQADTIKFFPVIKETGNLSDFYGYKTINYQGDREINALLKGKNLRKMLIENANVTMKE